MTAGYTLTEAFLYNQSPGFVSQLLPIDKLPVNPDGTITLDAGGNLPVATYRQPGLPEHLINLLATYKIRFRSRVIARRRWSRARSTRTTRAT